MIVDVGIQQRRSRIRVESEQGGVRLARPGHWEEQLTREEAWELAEALDAVATAGPEDDVPEV